MMERMCYNLALGFILIASISRCTNGCSYAVIPKELTMEAVLYKAPSVVYGRELSRTNNFTTSGDPDELDAIFEVFCVFKNSTAPINHRILIKRVYPVTSCSNTDLAINENVILSIQRTGSDFEWFEPEGAFSGAAFPATAENLQRALSVCGLRSPELSEGRPHNVTAPVCPEPTQETREKQCISSVGKVTADMTVSLFVCTACVITRLFIIS